MLKDNEIEEIRMFLEKATNPLFLFDDDPDGVCAFLLLKRFYKKGDGVATKGPPNLDRKYIDTVNKYNPDLIIVLDKPLIDQDFIDQCPCDILWLDHHPLVSRTKVHYYNPRKHEINNPTTYLAYQVTKSDLWIATLGCIFDYSIPDFIDEFIKQYPDLVDKKSDHPGDLIFKSNLSKLIRIFSFNIKGEYKDVKKSLRYLEKVETPYEILNQTTEYGRFIYWRYEKLNKEYVKLLEKAEEAKTKDKIYLFLYPSTKTSFTTELANELIYKNPEKVVIIAREKDQRVMMSLRSRNIKLPPMIEKALVGLSGYGGGHDYACGASVKYDDFERFIKSFKEQLE